MSWPTPYRALHRLSADRSAAALLGISIASDDTLAFPDPGCLAGTPPSFQRVHRLAGITSRKRCPTISGVSRMGAEFPPDLPSNCSSLRGLNCTHSNYKTQKSPVSVFIVTTSPCRDWVICAPAAFLGCGSRFSGSLSGIEP